MKIIAAILLFSSSALCADFQTDNVTCDVQTGKCERGLIVVHERPLTQAEAAQAEAKAKKSEQDKADARAAAHAHVSDCSSGKLSGESCSGAALAKDMAALLLPPNN